MMTLTLEPVITLTSDQFYQLCLNNRELRLERTATGELIVNPPTGGDTSRTNLDILAQLWNWNKAARLGIAFESSGGFHLPSGSDRSPDAAWVEQSRWDALTSEQKQKFVPLCPDFVIELRSPSDRLPPLQAKMQEYLANGCRFGWLIDRSQNQVEIYQLGQPVQILANPQTRSGASILPGFTLDLTDVWPL
ncbi:MAG: Uma2 family endonuclease [Spirulinaceae cyanobacterium]